MHSSARPRCWRNIFPTASPAYAKNRPSNARRNSSTEGTLELGKKNENIRPGAWDESRQKISGQGIGCSTPRKRAYDSKTIPRQVAHVRSEEHTSELQSLRHLVC